MPCIQKSFPVLNRMEHKSQRNEWWHLQDQAGHRAVQSSRMRPSAPAVPIAMGIIFPDIRGKTFGFKSSEQKKHRGSEQSTSTGQPRCGNVTRLTVSGNLGQCFLV